MPNPGEFYALISAGPFRGIPAIHLVYTPEKAPEKQLGKLVEDAANYFGLSFPGKCFIYLARPVSRDFVRALRQWDCYVIGEPFSPCGWMEECHHIMVGMKTPEWSWDGRCDSIVYTPEAGTEYAQPVFPEEVRFKPKFLATHTVGPNEFKFVAESTYPWSLQQFDKNPLCVPLSYIYKEQK